MPAWQQWVSLVPGTAWCWSCWYPRHCYPACGACSSYSLDMLSSTGRWDFWGQEREFTAWRTFDKKHFQSRWILYNDHNVCHVVVISGHTIMVLVFCFLWSSHIGIILLSSLVKLCWYHFVVNAGKVILVSSCCYLWSSYFGIILLLFLVKLYVGFMLLLFLLSNYSIIMLLLSLVKLYRFLVIVVSGQVVLVSFISYLWSSFCRLWSIYICIMLSLSLVKLYLYLVKLDWDHVAVFSQVRMVSLCR